MKLTKIDETIKKVYDSDGNGTETITGTTYMVVDDNNKEVGNASSSGDGFTINVWGQNSSAATINAQLAAMLTTTEEAAS